MNIRVQNGRNEENLYMDEGAVVQDVLSKLGLFADSYIVMRNKTPVPIDCILNDGDSLKLVKVASGG